MPVEIAQGSRMFGWIDETWNPVKGCKHGCNYCWARDVAKQNKLRHQEKYKDVFEPRLFPRELHRFRKAKHIFVVDMGDLFGDWVDRK